MQGVRSIPVERSDAVYSAYLVVPIKQLGPMVQMKAPPGETWAFLSILSASVLQIALFNWKNKIHSVVAHKLGDYVA